jgi:hypothetical protein
MKDVQFNAIGRVVGINVRDGEVRAGGTAGPLAGAHAIIATSGDVDRRISATRLLVTGPLAFGLRKKKDHRQLWLAIDGENFEAVVKVEPNNETLARRWAAEFNTRAMATAAGVAS